MLLCQLVNSTNGTILCKLFYLKFSLNKYILFDYELQPKN